MKTSQYVKKISYKLLLKLLNKLKRTLPQFLYMCIKKKLKFIYYLTIFPYKKNDEKNFFSQKQFYVFFDMDVCSANI